MLDLIVANDGPDTISLFRNLGNGSFGEADNNPTGVGPNSVAVVDLEGDGQVDLVVCSSEASSVSIHRNQGGGRFPRAMTHAVGSQPAAAASGDFDSDGGPDLAVANYGNNTIGILVNQGNLQFLNKPSLSTAGPPQDLVITDIDGDGSLDIATANYANSDVPGKISLFSGRPDGTFVSRFPTLEARSMPHSITSGDFNADGRMDLAVANINSSDVSLFLATPEDGFASPATLVVGKRPSSVLALDLDTDGKLDLVTGNVGDPSDVTVLYGRAGGAFEAGRSHAAGVDPHSMASGDLDLNGFPDLVVANSDARFTLLLGRPGRSFSVRRIPLPGQVVGEDVYEESENGVDCSDMDGDGNLDVLIALDRVAGNGPGNSAVALNDGKADFGSIAYYAGSPGAHFVLSEDLDGDAKVDVLVGGGGSTVSLLRNEAAPPLSLDSDADGVPDECSEPKSLQLPGDGNQDGVLDISDGIHLLNFLFLGTVPKLPCGSGKVSDPGNLSLLDSTGDGAVDLSDGVLIFTFLFQGAAPPFLGTDCVQMAGCPDNALNCTGN